MVSRSPRRNQVLFMPSIETMNWTPPLHTRTLLYINSILDHPGAE